MVIYLPDYFVISKVGDDDVAFVRDALDSVYGRNQSFSGLPDEFVCLDLGTVPDEYGEGSVDVLFAPLCEVAGHGIAHCAETDESYLEGIVARGTWTGERVGLAVVDVEEVSILWSIHGGRGEEWGTRRTGVGDRQRMGWN